MRRGLFAVSLLLGGVLLASPVFAYIDPGTAATVVGGSIWAFIVSIAAVVGLFFSRKIIKPLRNFFKRIFTKKKK